MLIEARYMKNTFAIAIISLAVLLSTVHAFSILPVFSSMQHCIQLNSTFISCPDGSPIPVSFSVSSPYMPYYGNFTVYVADNFNYTEPLNLYGAPCRLGSSTTITCTLTALPIPVGYSNGTISKSIEIVLVPSAYPQVRYRQYVNVTVLHYLTTYQQMLLEEYNYTSSLYSKINATYAYYCGTYTICNQSLYSNITGINSLLSSAKGNIYLPNGNATVAYKKVEEANSSLEKIIPAYISFVNSSNAIASANIKATYMLVRAMKAFESNSSLLYNCSAANGTTYGSNMAKAISALQLNRALNTMASASAYLNMTEQLNNRLNASVAACSHRLSELNSIGKINMPRYVLLYTSIAVIALLAIYSFFRLREATYINRVRSEKNEMPQEEEAVGKSSLEESFDKWFSSTISKQKQRKSK